MKELSNILSPERCKQLIEMSESVGYEAAPVTTKDGPVMMPDYRSNERVIHFSKELAEEIYNLLEDEFPSIQWLKHTSLNEMFRFYKYQEGHFFNQHRDGAYVDSKGQSSKVTLLIYLNEGYEGGETAYVNDNRQWINVKPETGKIFMFHHKVLHRSNVLSKGTKYVIRTDVMYKIA